MDAGHLHQLLKNETHHVHMRLHRHPMLTPLQDGTLTKEKYINILNGFYVFHMGYKSVFDKIKNKFSQQIDPVDLIEKDYETLCVQKPLDKGQSKDIETDFNAYIGYLYVLQGSTLGGQYLSKQIEKTIGLTQGSEQFYFYGYGKDTGKVWKSFLEYLEQNEGNVNEIDVLNSACAAFQNLENIFDIKNKSIENAA